MTVINSYQSHEKTSRHTPWHGIILLKSQSAIALQSLFMALQSHRTYKHQIAEQAACTYALSMPAAQANFLCRLPQGCSMFPIRGMCPEDGDFEYYVLRKKDVSWSGCQVCHATYLLVRRQVKEKVRLDECL